MTTVQSGPWVVNALPIVFQFIHSAEFGSLKLEFQDLKSNQEEQRKELDRLKIIVNLLITEQEFKHLKHFLSSDPWTFDKTDALGTNKFFEQELRRLRDLKLIIGWPNKGIGRLFNEGGDVKNYLRITDEGIKFIAFRNEVNEPPPLTSKE